MNDNYKGTMTTENLPGKVSTVLFPAYSKMGKDENGNRPATVAFGEELYTEIVKLMEVRQANVIGPDGKSALPNDKFMGMYVVYDEALAEGEFEIRWGA
jgi:hypothetical protein